MSNIVNRINQVMTLSDNLKYAVVKQAVYKNESYLVAVRVTSNEEDVLDEYAVFKEFNQNEKSCVEEIQDKDLIELICKYVGLIK